MKKRNFTLMEFEEYLKHQGEKEFEFNGKSHNDNYAYIEFKDGKFTLNIDKASRSYRKVPRLAITRIINDIKLVEAIQGKFVEIIGENGEPIFSKQEMKKLESKMQGIEGHEDFKVSEELEFNGIAEYITKDETGKDLLDRNEERVVKQRKRLEVALKREFGKHIDECLIETGSTARGTNVPTEEPDFDYVGRVQSIQELNEYLDKAGIPRETKGRIRKFPVLDSEVDLTFLVIPEENRNYLSSEKAITDRLSNIRKNQGEDTYKKVIANIIYAKKKLKQAGIYKPAKSRDRRTRHERWIRWNGSRKLGFANGTRFSHPSIP